jgi:hypothetical protein
MGADLPVLLLAMLVAAILVLIMRWVFSTSRPATGRPDQGPNANHGLLVPVLSQASRSAALAAKNRLSDKGIRCSMSRLDHDHYDVMVFAADLDAAQAQLAGEDNG